jgi:hypothetical protein
MFSETIELRGHIIDSLILPKVLDQILTHGANSNRRDQNRPKARRSKLCAHRSFAETSEALDDLILDCDSTALKSPNAKMHS